MNVGATRTIFLETEDTDWNFDTAADVVLVVHVNKIEFLRYRKGDPDPNNIITVDSLDAKKASAFITRDQSLTLIPGMLGVELYVRKDGQQHGILMQWEVELIQKSFSIDVIPLP